MIISCSLLVLKMKRNTRSKAAIIFARFIFLFFFFLIKKVHSRFAMKTGDALIAKETTKSKKEILRT
jgi:hypothetical protein